MRKGKYYRFVCVYRGAGGGIRDKMVPIIVQYHGMKDGDGDVNKENPYYLIELLWYEGFCPPGWTPPYTEREKDGEYGTLITAKKNIVLRIEKVDQDEVKKEVMLLAL